MIAETYQTNESSVLLMDERIFVHFFILIIKIGKTARQKMSINNTINK